MKGFAGFQNRNGQTQRQSVTAPDPKASMPPPSKSVAPRTTAVGSFLLNVVTPMWKKAADAISPRVVEPAEGTRSKSWASACGVITGLSRECGCLMMLLAACGVLLLLYTWNAKSCLIIIFVTLCAMISIWHLLLGRSISRVILLESSVVEVFLGCCTTHAWGVMLFASKQQVD